MNSSTCNTHSVQVTPGGSATLIVCSLANGSQCSKTSSASTYPTPGTATGKGPCSIGTVPQGLSRLAPPGQTIVPELVAPAVTSGSGGKPAWTVSPASAQSVESEIL